MGRIKHNVKTTVLSSSSGSSSTVIDVSNKQDMDLQLVYGAGNTTSAYLQVSVDGVNYANLTDAAGNSTSVSLDTGGGSHQWNIRGLESQQLKLVVAGDAVSISAYLSADG